MGFDVYCTIAYGSSLSEDDIKKIFEAFKNKVCEFEGDEMTYNSIQWEYTTTLGDTGFSIGEINETRYLFLYPPIFESSRDGKITGETLLPSSKDFKRFESFAKKLTLECDSPQLVYNFRIEGI